MSQINIMEICQGSVKENFKSTKINPFKTQLGQKDFLVFDQGFCEKYLNHQLEISLEDLNRNLINSQNTSCHNSSTAFNPDKIKNDKWKIRFYASNSFTTYFNSDVNFKSSRYNIEVKDYSWAERSSRDFFLPATLGKQGNTPFQFIDEPTNTFTLSIEKNGNEFFLSLFHPKYLQEPNQIKYIKGTIDGVPVDGVAPVNTPFNGYDQNSGESEITTNANTYREYNLELKYGHRFKLLDTKFGSIDYVPSIGAGIMMGGNLSAVIIKDKWWDGETYQEPYSIQGYGGSLSNRIEVNSKDERFGIFYENKLGAYSMDHQFLDGTQSYILRLDGNSAGIKFMIYNPNKH